MKTNAFLAVACAAALAGCDYTVPLTATPDRPIDPALVGLWERQDEAQGGAEKLLVLPLGKNEYLVSYPANSKNALFARATLCKAADLTLLQLTWFGTALGTVADDARIYQYATFTVAGDTLKGRLLNGDVVDRDAASAAALIAAIEANADSPKRFRDEWTFTKIKPPPDPHAALKRPPMPAGWQ